MENWICSCGNSNVFGRALCTCGLTRGQAEDYKVSGKTRVSAGSNERVSERSRDLTIPAPKPPSQERTMRTPIKLAILELIAGLFGWVWIIASFSGLYFILMAVGFHGKWSKVFWAFGIAAVSKWMTRGFMGNQQRVAFEAALVKEGYTPQDAAQEWITRYMKNS